MNCGNNATDQSSIGPNVRQWLQLGYWLLCALFLLFCAYPLFKLARERIALYILISKLLPALLFLSSSVLSYPFVIRLVAISQIVRQNLNMFSLVNHRLHIVALAANRAFAIILPILYSQKVLAHYSWTYLIVSSSFYVAIAIKLAWIKAKNRSLNASQSVDKNSGRITVTCFAIQIQAWLYLLLLILCEDVRDLFARMIGKVFSLIKKLKLTKIANVATQQSNQLTNANTRHYINQLANANTRHYSNQLANANTPHYANANTRHYSNQLANANTPHYANANSRHYSNQLVNANSRHYINQLANANTRHYSNQLANANTRQHNQLANANTPHYANANTRNYSNQLVNANSRHYSNQMANISTAQYPEMY
ncbi:hypothetical protein niasHT_032328 [Heterodera trifolii]|uniref:Uncharacterized protein n=1 Tax=Heterodera trifolii TaxID=157864 RepID=A0ABD2I315_9BILA